MTGRPRTSLGTWGKLAYTTLADGRVRVSGAYRDPWGTTHRIQRTGGSRAAADKLRLNAAQKINGRRTGSSMSTLTSESTIRELAELVLREYEQSADLATQTVSRYRASIRNHIIPTIGDLLLDEVDGHLLGEFLTTLNSKHPSEARSCRTIIRKMHTKGGRAIRDDWISGLPKRLIRRRGEVRALSANSVKALFTMLESDSQRPRGGPKSRRAHDTLRDVLTVQLGTGLRVSEVAAFRAEDVVLRPDGRVQVSVHGAVVYREASGTRTTVPGRKRPVYETPGRYIIQEHIKTNQKRLVWADEWAAAVLLRRAGATESGLLFATETGQPLNLNNLRRTLREVIGGSDFEGWLSTHTMRRTVGNAVAREHGEEAAAAALGHASVATTRESYIERVQMAPDVSSVTSQLR
ncbi:tyrosine-type recombinase/integrase [Leifsonia sp. fls2-241-R2A-40a]|uniref:tyrosine-type recombinase/integrase n=1 Tax=Leifsonia sp. fls2-241-R2A-40a TaxID=3040290 RepID=UPI00254C4D4F|nr:tyrosine-type recombinase/integrase [Leifsonia sp. fls2-241-R2A-40a]